MKNIFKIIIVFALFLVLATLSTLLFFVKDTPKNEIVDSSISDVQTPISRVRSSRVFSQFENFKGINSLTDQQKETISSTITNLDSVLKTLRELEDNTYRIDICSQLENRKIKPYSIKTPGLSYFFRGAYDGSESRDRFLLGEIFSSPWAYLARYEAFQEVYKVIAESFYSQMWDGKKLTISDKDIAILSTKVSRAAIENKDAIRLALEKSHYLLKMARLIQYKKDNKFNNDIREFCASTEDSILNGTDFDFESEYQDLLEIYNVKEEEFLSAKEREPIDINFKVDFTWLKSTVKETFNSKSEKIKNSIESDINK